MIPRHIAASFPADVRARGDQYYASRRVRIVSAGSLALNATVSGTVGYLVDLHAEPTLLTASCSCPYAGDHGICKHIWATLRQAEAERKLDTILRTAGQRSEFSALSSDQNGDDLWSDDDRGDRGNGHARAGFSPEAPWSGVPEVRRASHGTRARPPEWKSMLDTARRQMANLPPRDAIAAQWPADRRIVYIVDIAASLRTVGIVIELGVEKLMPDGTWEPPVQFRIAPDVWRTVPDPLDRQVAQMLIGAPPPNPYGSQPRTSEFVLRGATLEATLPTICETGRCRARLEPGDRPTRPIRWDDGPPWELRLRVVREVAGGCFVDAVLRRGPEEMLLSEPAMLHSEGWLVARGAIARFEHRGAFTLVPMFREKKSVHVAEADLPALLEMLYALPRRPALELPADTRVNEVRTPPTPGVTIHQDPTPWRKTHHRLEVSFVYGAVRVGGPTPEAETSLFDRSSLTVHHRDLAFEREAHERLTALGAKEESGYGGGAKYLTINANRLMRVILDLVAAGWRVEADGAVYRAPGNPRAAVRSGIDWFELDAGVRYGDIEVSLRDLLAARRAGAATIDLSDGSRGVIPVEWLARLGTLAAGGTVVDGVLRYSRAQTGLLDALLGTLPEANVDATFETARAELRAFDRVAPADPPSTFRGTLREYQREGLGWLHFLRTFGLGGCLADDMGLGKTVQVLALLDSRRDASPAKETRPSIVVVPRSLVFNWLREAERFAPRLRVLDYSGTGRRLEDIRGGVDVVITTYGTLRRDAVKLASIDFDYAILDEAQAIKTAGSASSKAARLLRADHRVAMTGTPIENRLEELWSLFEFLNPGMLGASSSFAALARLAEPGEGEPTGHQVLARALRPVILRRTKGQVAADLPARIEQTLSVDLEGAQRKFYDELLEAYRRSVLERVDTVGLGKARMHILEALLRLRQAACHPALADPARHAAPSAKLDALIPALEEVVAEGHKALVFSQFTSFLALLRARLDAAGVTYEYLDGRTRDRQAHVDRFEGDPACPLFLISLKAGGHGLNLVSADYVFILDPWWNPAVEAQAIDRAHRIGQTRRVIATRIVARDTIEEKILELQASKRALADAILGQDQGVLSQIGRAELEMLLR
ncbi:MAG: DEAD/DEAH box helicase [bacterium]